MKFWLAWLILVSISLALSPQPKTAKRLDPTEHKKLVRKTVRKIHKAHVKMKEVMEKKSKSYPSKRRLIVDDPTKLDLLIQAKKAVYGFKWKNGEYVRCPHSQHFELNNIRPNRHFKRPKAYIPLYDRYEERPLNTFQMDCTLEFLNYGLNFHKSLRMVALQVEFQSSCMKNSFTVYYYINELDKKNVPRSVKLNVKGSPYNLRFKSRLSEKFPNKIYGFYNFRNKYTPKVYAIPKKKSRSSGRKKRPRVLDLGLGTHDVQEDGPKKQRKLVKSKPKSVKQANKDRKLKGKGKKLSSKPKKKNDKKHKSTSRRVKKQSKAKSTIKAKRSLKQSAPKERQLSVVVSGNKFAKSSKAAKKRSKKPAASHRTIKGRKLPLTISHESSEKLSEKIMKLQRILDNTRPRRRVQWKRSGIKSDIIPGSSSGIGFHDYSSLAGLWASSNIVKCELNLVKTRMLKKWIVDNDEEGSDGPRWLRRRVTKRYFGMTCKVNLK